jgi:hypothetical protein
MRTYLKIMHILKVMYKFPQISINLHTEFLLTNLKEGNVSLD